MELCLESQACAAQVVRQASEGVFVPLTVGGGIREFTDADGKHWSALEVASEYFRSGADKVSIGGDAVLAAEEYRKTGKKTGSSSIEQISWVSLVCFAGWPCMQQSMLQTTSLPGLMTLCSQRYSSRRLGMSATTRRCHALWPSHVVFAENRYAMCDVLALL